jgi:hypothetical protein
LIEDFAAEARDPHRVVGGKAAGGVGQNRVAIGVEKIEHRATFTVVQPLAPDRDGHDLRARGVETPLHLLVAGVFAGANDQPRAERQTADVQRVIKGGLLCGIDRAHGAFFGPGTTDTGDTRDAVSA